MEPQTLGAYQGVGTGPQNFLLHHRTRISVLLIASHRNHIMSGSQNLTATAYDQLSPVIAHRGASGHAPENTAASLRKGAELGATWAEVDVAISSDNVAVVFHDSDVNRCTDGRGLLIQKTARELAGLDAGSWYSPFYAGERILTMTDLLTLANELCLNLNIEIKPTIGRETETVWAMREALKQVPFNHTLLLSSFNVHALYAAREFLPDFTRALNVEAIPRDWRNRLDETGATGLHFAADFFEEAIIRDIHAADTPMACYTVNDFETAQKLYRSGVKAVFTDYPERLILNASPVAR